MPTYSVTMFVEKPERPGWNKMQMLVKASNQHAAKTKASNRFSHPILRVQEIKPEHEREKWRRIWHKAHNNMPVFLRTQINDSWERQITPLPIGAYIKLEAKGLIRKGQRRSTANQFYVNHPHKKTWRSTRIKMLSRCLNYPQVSRMGQFVSVRAGLIRGTVPNCTCKQEVLKHLAGPRGQLIALKLLNGEHLYDPEAVQNYDIATDTYRKTGWRRHQ